MDNSSSEIVFELGYSGADVLIDAFNSTAADSPGNIGGNKKLDFLCHTNPKDEFWKRDFHLTRKWHADLR